MNGDLLEINIVEVLLARLSVTQQLTQSYTDLYQLYSGALHGTNAGQAFQRMGKSVLDKEKEISERLHTQAFVLLTGTAEATMKDIFSTMIVQNFLHIRNKSGESLKVGEVQNAFSMVDEGDSSAMEKIQENLGERIAKNIFSGKNPIEKINFQNVITTKQIFKNYFGLKFDVELAIQNSVHCYWQERHVIVHNNSAIDDRYITNIRMVRELKRDEKLGQSVSITKKYYDEAVDNFTVYFAAIEHSIAKLGMKCRMEGA